MSGVQHEHPISVTEEDEDPVSEWFMKSAPDAILVLHNIGCPTREGSPICDCFPVTLRRGAKA